MSNIDKNKLNTQPKSSKNINIISHNNKNPEIQKFNNTKKLILITSHIAADFDSVSSILSSFILLKHFINTKDLTQLKRYFLNFDNNDLEETNDNNNSSIDIICLLPPSQYPNISKFTEEHSDFLIKCNIYQSLTVDIINSIKYIFIVDTKRISRLKHIYQILFNSNILSGSPSSGNLSLSSTPPASAFICIGNNNNNIEESIINREIKSIYVCDHHPIGSDDIPNSIDNGIRVETTISGSNAALIVAMLKEHRIKLSDFEATVIAIGIYEDTGKFIYGGTSHLEFEAMQHLSKNNSLDMIMIKKFLSIGKALPMMFATTTIGDGNESINTSGNGLDDKLSAEVSALNQSQSNNIKVSDLLTLEAMKKTLNMINVDGCSIYTCELSGDESKHSLSPLIQSYLEINHTIQTLLVFIRAEESGTVVICRTSKDSPLDVGKICEMLGGGGHKVASSVTLRDSTLSEAKNIMFVLIYGMLCGKDIPVRSIMTADPLSVEYTSSISQVLNKFIQYPKVKYLLVVGSKDLDDEMYGIGLVSRNIVEHYYYYHDISDGYIKDVVDIGTAYSVSVNDSLLDVIKLMTSKNQWIIPIVKDDCKDSKNIVGVITATDILKTIIKEINNKRIQEITPMKGKDFSFELINRLPGVVFKFVSILHELCNQLDIEIYFTSKTVLEIISLDQQASHSIDKFKAILISNKPNNERQQFLDQLTKYITENSDWKVKQKEKRNGETTLSIFKTKFKIKILYIFNMFYPNSDYIYTFQPSIIKSYCFSKTYTFNSIVVSLKTYCLYDIFLGLDDYNKKILRTLHSTSFLDDPHTLLDILIISNKLGFKLSAETKRIIKFSTMQMSAAQRISGRQYMEFFNQIFKSEGQDYISILRDMQMYNIMQSISPNLQINNRLFKHLEDTIQWYHSLHLENKPDISKMRFLVFLQGTPLKEIVKTIFNRLEFNDEERYCFTTWTDIIKTNKKLIKKWVYETETNEFGNIFSLNEILSPLPLECILLMLTMLMDEQEVQPKNQKEHLYFLIQAPFSLYFNHSHLILKKLTSQQPQI